MHSVTPFSIFKFYWKYNIFKVHVGTHYFFFFFFVQVLMNDGFFCPGVFESDNKKKARVYNIAFLGGKQMKNSLLPFLIIYSRG